MNFLSLLLISIGLSLDTFAVSVSCGIKEKNIRFFEATRIASFFAIFQAAMPVIGWWLGMSVSRYVISFDHWIAFGLLTLIGIKMIADTWNRNNPDNCLDIYNIKVIVILALATTIDAFIIGFTFVFLNINLPFAVLVIGFTTYLFAMLGMLFGKKLGQKVGNKLEMLGGIILIGVGLKILVEHLQH